MLDGSRYFAEFPEENPDRARLSPALLSALVALEREISRFIDSEAATATATATDSVRCGSEDC